MTHRAIDMPAGRTGSDGIDEHGLAGLVVLDDAAFVNAAYERFLGRHPVDWERELWLAPLRRGSRSKLEVLVDIRHSREGSARAAAIPELVPPPQPGRMRRLPLVGPLLDWVHRLVTLGRLARRLDLLEGAVLAGVVSESRTADALTKQVDLGLRRIEEAKADRALVDEHLSALWRWATPLASAAAGPAATALRGDAASRSRFDDYYRAFEERHRGTREQIRDRLRYYLPTLEAVAQRSATELPVRFVDLGCGRGEMIELLRGHGLDAYGVENSDAMVASCGANGLPVVRGDAIAHLESLDAGAMAGVTCIHVIEHLPFLQLQALFAQCSRVLRPGGVAIFETPNPENLIVGACNFYYDPTHLRPLPPEPMRFLLEASGFVDVVIERLHPGAAPSTIDSATDPRANVYSTLMSVPQDYALIGYKPHVSAANSAASP